MLALTLALHLAAALTAPLLGRRHGRAAFAMCAAAAAASLVVLLPSLAGVLAGEAVTETYPWAADLGLVVELRLDGFGALMALLVVGIELLVAVYAYGYFSRPRPDLGRFAGTLTGFAGAMLGLVLSDHLLLVFTFWELTSITSYLLIGTDDHRSSARSAGLQALLTTGLGGLAMLAGFVVLGQSAGTYSLSQILAQPPTGAAVEVALVLVLLGAFTKSAQVPFHAWLPGAMAAPTPVSAYLHSATMVKAGIYLIARFAPAFADAGVWRPLVLTVGATTMLVGGWRALRQHDLKLVLAYGTISQLGFLTLLFGAGYAETTMAGVALLLAHAAFKASLFMTVGIVDHQTRTRDLRRLSGLGRAMLPTAAVAIAAAASMAGLPPLLGFVAKEAAFEALLHHGVDALGTVLIGAVLVGSVLTVAYTARYVWGAFAAKSEDELADDVVAPTDGRPARSMVAPAAALAALGVALGVVPAVGSPLVLGAAQALDPTVPDYPLSLWHGFNLALAMSAVAVAAGAAAWAGRRRVERWQTPRFPLPDAGAAYQLAVNGTLASAKRVTAVAQNGSLPIYLGVILLTVLVVPGGLLLTGDLRVTGLRLADHPMQIVVAAIIVIGAVATCALHQRFAAVLALGAVGYGIAVLFVLQGAPDLALTQLLIETLILVLFVLVLRHLPEAFQTRRWRLGQAPRILLAVATGVLATVFTAVAVGARSTETVATEYLDRALPDGGGRNVVNVILVDFRGFDTFGEIVVLTATALGVLALVRSARRERRAKLAAAAAAAAATPATPATPSAAASSATPSATVATGGPTPAPGSGLIDIAARQRSVILETGVRAVFRPLVLFSIYLLFAGHNDPGGGFIGGLVAGAALILLAVAEGAEEAQRRTRLSGETLLGTGIVFAAASAAVGWLAGGEFLTRASTTLELPVLGPLYVSTTATFDLGVYLVVVGLVVAMLRSLGSEEVAA